MSFTSATDVHNSMLVSLQCAAALILTLVAATLLKAYGVLEDRGVDCEPNAGYCWETFGQDSRCFFSFFMGALLCHLLDAEGRRSGRGIASALRGPCASLI